MSSVFVTDGRSLASLAVVRSLGRRGIDVYCGETFPMNLSRFSKYVTSFQRYPSPDNNPEAFVRWIVQFTRRQKIDLVLPVRDSTTLLLSKHKRKLPEQTRVYLPEGETVERLDDKAETLKIAESCEVATPRTYFPERLEVREIKEQVEYPVLVRPRGGSGSRGITYVESEAEFDGSYRSVLEDYGLPIVQEYVDKTGYSTACILLDGEGECKASFSYERLKEYPTSGGPTVVGKSSDDPEVKRQATTLLREAGWKGAAEVEFILDEEGVPLLLEVNPRFWTPIELAIRSGVDFPYLIYKLSRGHDVDPVHEYRTGVVYRWLLPNEILWLMETENKLQGSKELFSYERGRTCFGTLSKDDPFPVIGTAAQALSFLTDAEKRAIVFDRGWN